MSLSYITVITVVAVLHPLPHPSPGHVITDLVTSHGEVWSVEATGQLSDYVTLVTTSHDLVSLVFSRSPDLEEMSQHAVSFT